jgi:hypothetical protein
VGHGQAALGPGAVRVGVGQTLVDVQRRPIVAQLQVDVAEAAVTGGQVAPGLDAILVRVGQALARR